MVRFRFKKGLRFKETSGTWTLMRQTATCKLQFEEESSGEIEVLTEREFYQRWESGRWVVDESSLGFDKDLIYLATPKDLKALSEPERLYVQHRLDYLNPLIRHFGGDLSKVKCKPAVIEQIISAVAKQHNCSALPHWSTVWRWWMAYRSQRCFSKIVDRRSKNGFKTDKVQFSVFEEVVSEVYLNSQRLPGKEVVDGVRNRYWRINQSLEPSEQLTPPSAPTIYRWLKNLRRNIVDSARLGKAETERALRVVTGMVGVKSLLERVEIDHTPIDLMAVCATTRLPLGRPELTHVVDRRSRMILGFYISFHVLAPIQN